MSKRETYLPIPQIQPDFSAAEVRAVARVMRGGWIAEGAETERFERLVAAFLGVPCAVAVPSGTVAVALSCMASGLAAGEEVIVPNLTMAGTANGVLLAGGVPVFADVRSDTLTLDPVDVERRITHKTKIIMPVHLNGRSADMVALLGLARKHKLFLIEDAAQALGSRWGGNFLGGYGDFGCFSFSVPKIVTTGQGGMVVTRSKQLRERLGKLKDQGRRIRGGDIHDSIGFNFRFSDLLAAVGVVQMRKIAQNMARKRRVYSWYREALVGVPQVEFVKTDLLQTVPWFVDVLVPRRDALAGYLRERGVETRSFYQPLHQQGAYRAFYRTGESFPVTERVAKLGLWLPSSVGLTRRQVVTICTYIRRFFQ